MPNQSAKKADKLLTQGGVLVPKIWTRADHECALLGARVGRDPVLPREAVSLGEHLLLGVAELVSDGVVAQSWELQPSQAGVPLDEALAAAVKSIDDLTLEPFDPIDEGVFSGPWLDGAGSARIVLTDRFLGAPVVGDPVVFLPTPDLVVVTGSEDVRGIDVAVTMAWDALEQDPQPLTGIPLILSKKGVWSTWKPAVTHKCHRMLSALRTRDWMSFNTAQSDLLVQLGEHPAKVTTDEKDAEVSEWPEAEQVLLLETGLVRIGRKGPTVRWESVQHVLSRLLERTELYPPRSRTRGFPTSSEIAAVQDYDASYL